MRIYLECEKCGEKTEVHRFSNGGDVRFDHDCAKGPGFVSYSHGPFEKGPIHIDRTLRGLGRSAAY